MKRRITSACQTKVSVGSDGTVTGSQQLETASAAYGRLTASQIQDTPEKAAKCPSHLGHLGWSFEATAPFDFPTL